MTTKEKIKALAVRLRGRIFHVMLPSSSEAGHLLLPS